MLTYAQHILQTVQYHGKQSTRKNMTDYKNLLQLKQTRTFQTAADSENQTKGSGTDQSLSTPLFSLTPPVPILHLNPANGSGGECSTFPHGQFPSTPRTFPTAVKVKI